MAAGRLGIGRLGVGNLEIARVGMQLHSGHLGLVPLSISTPPPQLAPSGTSLHPTFAAFGLLGASTAPQG